MDLHTFFRSSTSFRLRIALAFKGIPYNVRTTSLPKMEHRAAEYLRLNPQGLVPALVDDGGKVFSQSMAMIEYLDEVYPRPPLMPIGALDKWYVRAVSQIIGCDIHPLNNTRVLKYLKSFGLVDSKINGDWYTHWIAEGLGALEGFLVTEERSGRFCLGEQFTMADVCLVPQIHNAHRFNCDTNPYPTVMRVFEAANTLDCVLAALPSKQPDAF